MAVFKFRLEQVLRYRTQLEDEAKQRLAEATRVRDAIRFRITEIDEENRLLNYLDSNYIYTSSIDGPQHYKIYDYQGNVIYDISVLNTICSATKERQTETARIADRVDAMIVIGDKRSSNTQKLFEICKNACNNTYYIQTLDDLNVNQLRSVETVGITAGASTPNKIIEEVQNNVRINF